MSPYQIEVIVDIRSIEIYSCSSYTKAKLENKNSGSNRGFGNMYIQYQPSAQ